MKKIFTLLTASLLFLSFAFAGETVISPETMNRDAIMKVNRVNGVVNLDLYFKNIDNVASVTIERSSASTEGYRQVKLITASDLESVDGFKFSTQDKYPLPENIPSYYRVVLITKDGVEKIFTGVLVDGI